MVTAMLVLLISGCGRKHIVSSPPAHRPAKLATPAAAPQPEATQAKPKVIEETYVVDAPEEAGAPGKKVMESDLVDEPAAAEATDKAAKKEAGTIGAAATSTEPTAKQPVADASGTEPAPPLQAGTYSVQIGAFSDLENANRALAHLLSDGYKGSRLSRTEDGLFRVQTGTYPDEASAREALSKLQAKYPKGFVLSSPLKK